MKLGDLIHYHPSGELAPILGILVRELIFDPKRRGSYVTRPAYRMTLLGQDGVKTYDVYFGINMPLIVDDYFVP